MGTELSTTNFNMPNPKSKAGKVVIGLGVAALGYGLYKILPYLIQLEWNIFQMCVAGACAFAALYIVFNKTFWRRLKIIADGIGKLLFGWFVEMNPFNILRLQIDETIKKRGIVKQNLDSLKGQQATLEAKLKENNQAMIDAADAMKIIQKNVQAGKVTQDMGSLEYTSKSNELANSKSYIDGITPLYNDTKKLATILDKSYTSLGFAIKDATARLDKIEDLCKTASAGKKATDAAYRAFTGDPEMNSAADIAMRKLQQDIGSMIGATRNTIQELDPIMNERDLNDAVKVNQALKSIEDLKIDSHFDYVASIKGGQILDASVSTDSFSKENKYLDYFNK